MGGNAQPQFTRQGNISSVLVTAANTSSEGGGTIGTDTFLAFTADATNGSFVDTVRWIPTATATTTTTATVGRVYISSQASGAVTSANNFLIAEVTLPAISADNSGTPVYSIDVPVNYRLPAGWTILVQCYAAPAANSAWRAVAFGGDY
jgi:hypothetical protein